MHKEREYSNFHWAQTGVAQWAGRHPANPEVAGLTPSQGTCLGSGPGQMQVTGNSSIFLSLSISLPSLLFKNKKYFVGNYNRKATFQGSRNKYI